VVADQQNELAAEHSNRFHEFLSQMLKVYLFNQLTRKINRQAARKLASMGLNHNQPITGILEFFDRNCKRGFDDVLVATLTQRLGQSMKSMRLDNELGNGGEKQVLIYSMQLKEIYAHRLFHSFLD